MRINLVKCSNIFFSMKALLRMSKRKILLKVVFRIFLWVDEKLTNIPHFFHDLLHHERIISWEIPCLDNLIQDFTMNME